MTISVSITNEERFEHHLKELAHQRNEEDAIAAHIKMLDEKLRMLPEYQQIEELKSKKLECIGKQKEIEDTIRYLAIQSFDGQNKTPVDGVQIKMFDVVEVTDEKAALAWASVNMPKAVKLDRRTFDSAVKKLELPFVVVKEEPKAQIASDLSKYL